MALVGDASGTVDAVTGHGLSLSFQQAIPLAEAMRLGDLAHYQTRSQKHRGRAHYHDAPHASDGRKRLDSPQNHSLVSENAGLVLKIAGDSHGGDAAFLDWRG